MGTGDPIRQLREVLSQKPLFSERNGYAPLDRKPLLKLLDEIEDKYIALPVDSDGVPWHVGDVIENVDAVNREVEAMFLNRHGWMFTSAYNTLDPSMHCHAKHATVESLLEARGPSHGK